MHDIMLNVRKPEVSDERLVRVGPEELQVLLRAVRGGLSSTPTGEPDR